MEEGKTAAAATAGVTFAAALVKGKLSLSLSEEEEEDVVGGCREEIYCTQGEGKRREKEGGRTKRC